MSKSPSGPRLYTPRTSRALRPRVDPDAVGQATESIARFFGTGSYLLIQTVIVVVWIIINIIAVSLRFNPYPFILLNLAFSTQAAYAAPLILLAQNRQENRDRVTLEEDRRGPRRPRPIPNTWPASWPRCGWRSATWQRPANTCAANWKTYEAC